jgi:hypothetical protein
VWTKQDWNTVRCVAAAAIVSDALASGMALLPSCDGQLCPPFQVSSTR